MVARQLFMVKFGGCQYYGSSISIFVCVLHIVSNPHIMSSQIVHRSLWRRTPQFGHGTTACPIDFQCPAPSHEVHYFSSMMTMFTALGAAALF